MAIIPCRECAHQVSDQAVSCPSCGVPIALAVETKPRLKHPIWTTLITLMTLWTLGTLVWVILPKGVSDELITRARLTLQGPDRAIARLSTTGHSNATAPDRRTNAAAAPALALRPVYRTTAEQLYRAYDANAVALQNSIGASLVRITGSVAAIDQDATGHPVVKLWTGDDSSAAMTLAENQRAAAAQLVKGEGVDIECDHIGHSGAALEGNGCSLAFVDTRTHEVNLALFLTTQSGAAHVYVVGPMPESVCRARSVEISSRLPGIQRGERLVWRNCTDGTRESILPGGCRLNSRPVALSNVPSAHLWRYDCSSSAVARTAAATRPTSIPATDTEAAEATPAVPATQVIDAASSSPSTAPTRLATPIEIAAAEAAAPPDSAPTQAQRATASNIRVASAATSDIGTATAATGTAAETPMPGAGATTTGSATGATATTGPAAAAAAGTATAAPGTAAAPGPAAAASPSSPTSATVPDDLTQVRAADPNAASHIAAYCSKTAPLTSNRYAFIIDCRRSEAAAWTRFVLQNEFPTLDDATRRKCSEPPFPDTYVAKEACARYALHVN